MSEDLVINPESGMLDTIGMSAFDVVENDARYLLLTGGILTGDLDVDGGDFTFNASKADKDFAVYTVYTNPTLFVDGDAGRVGVNTTAPKCLYHINSRGEESLPNIGAQTLFLFNRCAGTGDMVGFSLVGGNQNQCAFQFGDTESEIVGIMSYFHSTNYLHFRTAGAWKMSLSNWGRLIIGATAQIGNEGDIQLRRDGVLAMKETTTPTADTDYGKVYCKDDNKLYFQDGAGAEHEISLAT